MSMVDKLLSSALKMGMYEYCDLEAADDEQTLVTKEGGLLTVVEVRGSYDIIGEHRFPEAVETLYGRLAGNLRQPGRRIQFVFARDPMTVRSEVKKSTDLMRQTRKNLELNIGQIIDEKEEMMVSKVSSERCYMVITTMPRVLSEKSSIKAANNKRKERSKQLGVGMKPGEWGQSPFVAMDSIRSLHQTFVANILNVFRGYTLMRVMDAHEAIRCIKMEISPDTVAPDWRPTLTGDRMRPRLMKHSSSKVDVSHIMNPEISFQLFNQKPRQHEDDPNLIVMGRNIIAPVIVDIPPIEPKPFWELFSSIDFKIPWRFSMFIDSGHDAIMSKLKSRHAVASLLAFTTSHNRLIREAAEELMGLGHDGTLVSCSMALATWGQSVDEVMHRKGVLIQAVQSWGQCDVIEEKGDILESWCDTLPAFVKKPISTPYPEVLDDALALMPFTRPASPWEKGTMLYGTIDNKLFPYQAFSSLQSNPTELVFAPPGSGKSFYLNAANMAAVLTPGNRILPKITIMDVGTSSFPLIELLRSALPKARRHEVQSFRIKMEAGMTINPFDTPLGCDRPLAIDKRYLVNFMDLLLTPAGSKETVQRLPELCDILVDEMYEYFLPGKNAKQYSEFVDEELDEALRQHQLDGVHTGETTWYQIRDMFFERKLYHEAYLAHRQALPNLQDATTVLNQSTTIRDLYGNTSIGGSQESLVEFANTAISSAISSYPILSGPSLFDTGGARIMAVDLRDVAQGGSAAAAKMTNICFMLTRKLCSDYYRQIDTLSEIPKVFREYHEKTIERDAQVPKRICMDEFHVTQGSPQIRKQVEDDIRQGRKFNVGISLLSQELSDFTSTMISLATNVYVFSRGLTEDTPDKIRKMFGLTRDADRMFRLHVTGPTPEDGSTFLYLGSVKGSQRRVEQVLRLALGATERWAYSTTPEDIEIRRQMTARVGIGNALKVLAKEFPGGTAKDDIKRRMELNDASSDASVYAVMADELIKKHRKIIEKY